MVGEGVGEVRRFPMMVAVPLGRMVMVRAKRIFVLMLVLTAVAAVEVEGLVKVQGRGQGRELVSPGASCE